MDRRRKQALLGWLEAERRGDEAVAERALGAFWRYLGRPAPRPGFARRTLARAGLRRPVWVLPGPRWLPRGVLAACLALVAVSAGLVPAFLVGLAATGDRLLSAGVGVVAALSERLAHGLTAWNVAKQISQSLVAGLTDPSALAALMAALVVSLFAFGWLRQLLALERSAKHA